MCKVFVRKPTFVRVFWNVELEIEIALTVPGGTWSEENGTKALRVRESRKKARGVS